MIYVDRKKASNILYLCIYCTCPGTVQLLNNFFPKNLTLLYFKLELQGSPGKEQLASLLDFMLYIRRACFPLSECKRKWKLWASLKSWKCIMCQFHSHNTWIKSLVWDHLANKTRLFSTIHIFCIKFTVTFYLNYVQCIVLGIVVLLNSIEKVK